jgi:uncharacterized RDD family membrane protein YckC
MTTEQEYITRVLNALPAGTPRRDQIAMELRGHIAERLAGGQPLDQILHQLGDPTVLAESYLSAVPLVSASFADRAAAKLIDAALVIVPFTMLVSQVVTNRTTVIVLGAVVGMCLQGLYQIAAESSFGQTVGKRLLGVRVVRESGARIGVGQAIVRALPYFLSVFWIDGMFALFTEKSQRAFELLSKTRVVIANEELS